MNALSRIFVVIPVFVACTDNSPARIDIAMPKATILDDKPTSIGATLVNKAGQPLATPTLTYSAAPGNVVAVTPDGQLTCRASGDAAVIVAGGGQSATVSVSCRLVTSIEAPSSLRLTLGNRPNAVAVVVRDEAGRIVTDVPLSTTSSAPGVARYADGAIVPVGVGHAVVALSAGKATAVTNVDVVELVNSKTVALSDGTAEVFTLQQGMYDVDIRVKATNGSPYGVTVAWVGADCPAAKESQEHHIRCKVAETASMTVLNPTSFGLGPAATGFINIYRTAQ